MNSLQEQLRIQQQRLSPKSVEWAKGVIQQAENPHPLTDHKAVVEAKQLIDYMPRELYLKAKGIDL